MLRVGWRYTTNLMSMVARQEGPRAGMLAGIRFVSRELAKLPKIAIMMATQGPDALLHGRSAAVNLDVITEALIGIGHCPKSYYVDVYGFHKHINGGYYPANYAAGPMLEGGHREQKVLEYFASLSFISARAGDVVIDIASEWSIFPEILRKLTGSTVYQQDLVYPSGVNGFRIGSNAAEMPIPNDFANYLVLHNSFEHFEGTSDTKFILEAWRVLKPGGTLCILPLNLAIEHTILTDPLSNRTGIVFDPGARVIEAPWFHNRFGRFYDANTLQQRILEPASSIGFEATIYRVVNLKEIHPKVYLHFILVLHKPIN